jgi:hypothetical protein
LRYRPLGRAVTIALWRANNKPPVELVVANLVIICYKIQGRDIALNFIYGQVSVNIFRST